MSRKAENQSSVEASQALCGRRGAERGALSNVVALASRVSASRNTHDRARSLQAEAGR